MAKSTVVRDYIQTSKPRININNLFSVFAGYILASGTLNIDLLKLLNLLIGTGLVIAGSSIINNVYDREIDLLMERTRERALPQGRISPLIALIFAFFVTLTGLLILFVLVNSVVALLGAIGFFVYVFIYTMWLKRSSIFNTVVGGISGAVPPMMGWAAVTNSLDLSAWGLFLLLFLWQPPHFFALAILRRKEYKAANIPMLPVIKGLHRTIWEINIFVWLLVISTFLFNYTGVSHIFYGVIALTLGITYIYLAIKGFYENDVAAWAKKMFFYSLYYLIGILMALILDVAITDFW